MNAVERRLYAMAKMNVRIDVLLTWSIQIGIRSPSLDRQHIVATCCKYDPLRKLISEKDQDDMCTHTCDYQVVYYAMVSIQA